jgi:hypothetical protein
MRRVLARWPFLLLALISALLILDWWFLGPTLTTPLACLINPFIERATGEIPEAKVAAYLEAIRQGNRASAYNCWRTANEHLGTEYETRRQAVTKAISALGSDLLFRVLDVEWWSNCCEPCVIDDPRRAGFARLRVAVGVATEKKITYVFDVWVTGGPYYGDMMGCPVRHWEIIDAYPEGEEPLYWRWPREWQW